MRPIDADALLKKQTTIRVTYHCQGADEWDDYEAVLVKDINNAPTVSPDEVRGVGCEVCWDKPSATEKKENGRWKTYVLDGAMGDRPTVLACSNCRRVSTVKTPYCAQCGAKMEVSEDA